MTSLRHLNSPAPPIARESFDEFFRQEYPRAVKLAWLLTRSESAAEDVAQDAMLGVHRRFGELDSPSAYLTSVVVNRCRRWHRSGASQLRLLHSLSSNAERHVDTIDAADEYVLDAIAALPFRQRVVIIARYWGDWSEVEIATSLHCRPGTVKSLASRALARLRTELPR
ncbi:MAG: SigE family RNA polymerase sigma factor [Pseudonocardiales bacterium]|nr:MAG: SigE family RNA polymerase sigma factor [Pseudonocardiales bacterium]